MRLDHIAYRVADKKKSADFFISAFGYKIQTEFDIKFENGSTARCITLEPPEKVDDRVPFTFALQVAEQQGSKVLVCPEIQYHLAPEIFLSDGDPESIVGQWVANRNGIGGIHHLAYQVSSVKDKMKEWSDKGFAEFISEEPITSSEITQVFTKPSSLTGIIYEFIERGKFGFCQDNVKDIMESTKDVEKFLIDKLKADHPKGNIDEPSSFD